MTTTEFDNQDFGAGDKVRYKDGNTYYVKAVCFEENLLGLQMNISGGDPSDITWVRCENVEYIPSDRHIK